jgi:hypothetical protein
MHYHGRQILPWAATPGVTGDSWSALTEAGRDVHRLDTLVNLRNKAEVWRGYLFCPCSRDPLAMGSYPDTLKEYCGVCSIIGVGRMRSWVRLQQMA